MQGRHFDGFRLIKRLKHVTVVSDVILTKQKIYFMRTWTNFNVE